MSLSVSIIIPVYNVAPYIEDCLQSVMQQTYQGNMECLIVDDCGTDDSMVIAEKMIDEYVGPIQFKILHHESNRGLSAARNKGTLQATGEYIYYLDSDDEITDDCISKLIKQVEANPSIEMVQGNSETIPRSPHYPRKITLFHAASNEAVRDCYYQYEQTPCTAWNKLIRRDFLIKHQLWFKAGILYEDLLWSFYLTKHLTNVCFEFEVTYYHHVRPGSIMTGTEKATAGTHFLKVYHEIQTNLSLGYENNEFDYYANRFCYIYLRYIRFIPEFRDEYRLYWTKAREYHNIGACIRLAISKFLGEFYGGWLVWALMKRIARPSLLLYDIRRI